MQAPLWPMVRGIIDVSVRAPGVHAMRSLPHDSLVLSLQLGAPLSSREHGQLSAQGSALTGLRQTAVDYRASAGTHSVIALLSPRAALHLFGRAVRLDELANQRVALATLWSASVVSALEDALRAHQAPMRRAQELEAFIASRLAHAPVDTAAERFYGVLDLATGHENVAELANVFELSARQLQRNFLEFLGMPPKVWLSLRRTQRALVALARGEVIARVASSEGFADQAHLAHCIRRHTDRTPATWARLPISPLGKTYRALTGGTFVVE